MPNNDIEYTEDEMRARHLRITHPSEWVARFAPLIPAGGLVLDLASGGGRHSHHLLSLGYRPLAIDKNAEPLVALQANTAAQCIVSDLEADPAPFHPNGILYGQQFEGIVVVNYLHRPLMPHLIAALKPGGILIYETFAVGNEKFTRPRNPDHLLKDGELLDLVKGHLHIIAYESGIIQRGDIPGVKQRICAVNDPATSQEPHFLYPE